MIIDWSKMKRVHEGARVTNVSFTLNYVDVDDQWYFTVESVEPGENWIGKPTDLDAAITSVLNWLHRIALTKN